MCREVLMEYVELYKCGDHWTWLELGKEKVEGTRTILFSKRANDRT
jgi:hypothetical protein